MKGAFVRSSFENVRIKSLIIGDEISLTAKLLPREEVFRPFWLLFVLTFCALLGSPPSNLGPLSPVPGRWELSEGGELSSLSVLCPGGTTSPGCQVPGGSHHHQQPWEDGLPRHTWVSRRVTDWRPTRLITVNIFVKRCPIKWLFSASCCTC